MRPLFFGPPDRPLFGWMHDAPAPSRVGALVVSPFGYEAICAHRSLRHLADAIAHAGLPTLRFDHDGAGDSAGDDRDPDRLAAWVKGVHAAIAALGVERVCLVGVRLGALVAAIAAAERTDVEAFVAIAPVVSGRAYLRELKMVQGDDADAALGFVLTPDTRAAIAKVHLAKLPRPPRTLVLDRDDLPGAAELADADVRTVPGYVEMMLDPHRAVVPAAILAATRDWLAPLAAPGGEIAHVRSESATERAVTVGSGAFGILAGPPGSSRTGRAILFLNAGAVHRVGPNRLWTTLARRWAARGHVTLRLDFTGIGDAPPRPGADENVVYSPHALADVAAAVAFLRALPGVTEVRALGLCSGAYHAFRAVAAGHPLAGVVVINPLTYFWRDGLSLDQPKPLYQDASDVDRYSKNILRPDKWRKVLRGGVDVVAAARTVGRHAATVLASHARDVSRAAGFPWREDLGADLEAIARRRVDLQFVFAAGDPGLPLLRAQAGSALPVLERKGAICISTIDGADHTFTPVWSHEPLTRLLDQLLA